MCEDLDEEKEAKGAVEVRGVPFGVFLKISPIFRQNGKRSTGIGNHQLVIVVDPICVIDTNCG